MINRVFPFHNYESAGFVLNQQKTDRVLVLLLLTLSVFCLGPLNAQVLAPQVTQTPPPASFVVVLDPGHGGSDQGVEGTNLLKEKDLTLDLARRVKKLLTAGHPDFSVVLTRSQDSDFAYTARIALANREKGSLFVSLHAGSSFAPASNGFEVFCALQGEARDTVTASPAASLKLWRWNEAQYQFIPQSLKAAQIFQKDLEEVFKKIQPQNFPCVSLGVSQAPLLVLEGVAMPAVALELGNMAQQKQAELFKEESYRQELAAAIAAAIEEYHLKGSL